MPKRNNGEPDWLNGEAERAAHLHDSGKKVNNPSASKMPPRSSERVSYSSGLSAAL